MTEPLTITVKELADHLGMTREHVSRNYTAWGFKPVAWSKSPRFLRSDLDAFLEGGNNPHAIHDARFLRAYGCSPEDWIRKHAHLDEVPYPYET